jgi:hypothetical protein
MTPTTSFRREIVSNVLSAAPENELEDAGVVRRPVLPRPQTLVPEDGETLDI